MSESEMYRSGEFADRALACEEACEGIPTAALEAGVGALLEERKAFADLAVAREAALREALNNFPSIAYCDGCKDGACRFCGAPAELDDDGAVNIQHVADCTWAPLDALLADPSPAAEPSTKRRIEMWVARARTVLKRQHKGAKKGE